jgi:NAD(P)-dependent dehydrogenase (short-subunit alcohol dehydrogenase family)
MAHLFSYQGLRVVVTGGASGVGAALLEVLAELDVAHVTVLDLNAPSGPHDAFVSANLGDEAAVRAAIDAIGEPVHVLFNNAGVADTQPPAVVFAVNYLAVRTLSESLLDRMPEGSAIVNTASIAGNLWRKRADTLDELLSLDLSDSWKPSFEWFDEHTAEVEQAIGPYNFTKELVERFTMRSSRATMRRGVRTNALCPGPIDTPLDADFRAVASDKIVDWSIREMAGRPISPREVAGALAFLGSPAASYVNGVNLDIDGGFSAALATRQLDMSGR